MNGLELQKIRKQLKLTQTELAEKVGVSMRTVQNWEKDINKIPKSTESVVLQMANYTEPEIKQQGETDPFTLELIKKLKNAKEFKEIVLEIVRPTEETEYKKALEEYRAEVEQLLKDLNKRKVT